MAVFFAAVLTVVIVAYTVIIVWGFVEAAREVGFGWAAAAYVGLGTLIFFAAGISATATGVEDSNAFGALVVISVVIGIGLAAFYCIARANDFDFSESKLKLAGWVQIVGLAAAIVRLIKAFV